MGKIIGIDLGTTNSCVAVMEGNDPVVIPNSEGGRTTPSVVAFTKNGERLVGQPAKRQAITNSKNTIFSIKRFMGRNINEVSDEKTKIPYEVISGDNGSARVQIGDRVYSPPEISAMILQKMKKTAEDYLGQEVTEATIDGPRERAAGPSEASCRWARAALREREGMCRSMTQGHSGTRGRHAK